MRFEKNKDIYEQYVYPDCFYTVDKCTCELYPPYELIMIDKNIQEHVRILNEKGYGTSYSCESHSPNGIIYIKFWDDYKFGSDIELPNGFNFDKRQTSIRHSFNMNITMEEFEEEKKKCLDILLDWCKSLPENE